MPPIKLQHVVSCSSEDPNHKADNLLKDETYRKWKCKSAGEKNVSVILQFEKSTQIHSIDIGNDGSAFVEVLVGKSTSDEFQVILVSSSFMSPAESKNCNNVNRVRIFGSDKLSKTVCNQNWDRVKIVCTQPFNKHTAFGLSFIKFHSPPLPGEEKPPAQATTTTLGAFKIRSDSPQKITPGLFFKTAKEKKETEPIKDAAAVRAAPTVAASTETTASSTCKSPLPSTQSKRKLSQDEVKPSMSKKRSITPPKERKPEVKAPPLKKTKSEPTKASTGKEFSQLMKGVVFALSGFQNPKRGNIRDKALDMGAKYKSDWCNECTHLICAFANTPKYNQVKKKGGKIVSEKWIFDCYKRKMRLPWKSYRIGDASSDEESEEESEEMDDEEEDDWVPTPKKTTPKKVQKKTTPKQKPVTAQKKENTPKKLSPKAAPKPDNDDEMYGGSTDEDEKKSPIKKRRVSSSSSGSDTEDEIERIKQQEKRKSKEENNDDLGGSTDEDMDVNEQKNGTDIPDLPDFFKRMHFFFYGTFSAQERRVLNRYIMAYDGAVEEYMTDKVQYVLTHSEWDDNFDQALSDNTTLAFIRPKWIYACYDKQKIVPYQPYVVVPK